MSQQPGAAPEALRGLTRSAASARLRRLWTPLGAEDALAGLAELSPPELADWVAAHPAAVAPVSDSREQGGAGARDVAGGG